MGFKLNIGKDGGGGSTGFSLKQSLNMIKAKGMSSQMIGTDVMKDGYYNTVNESGAGSPSNFNAGLRKASASGKLDDNPKFKAAVDASGEGMPMKDGPYMMGTAPTLKPDEEENVAIGKSETKDITRSSGRGGKQKGTRTTTTVERVKGEGTPDAARKGVNRLGIETVDTFGSDTRKRTVLSGSSGFRKDGTGYVKEASVNAITPRSGNNKDKDKITAPTLKKNCYKK
tara:strand:+ start:396 stop:1079 length:684 start_codon:yes stop_codon:yes gene_type:complete